MIRKLQQWYKSSVINIKLVDIIFRGCVQGYRVFYEWPFASKLRWNSRCCFFQLRYFQQVTAYPCSIKNIAIILVRRIWRYQRGNQNPYIEEEQKKQAVTSQSISMEKTTRWFLLNIDINDHSYSIPLVHGLEVFSRNVPIIIHISSGFNVASSHEERRKLIST